MKDIIIVDGVEYVKKQEIKGDYVIVRTNSAGVFAGILLEDIKNIGSTVTLQNARRLWYWEGAASLSELAVKGVSKPDSCKFPCEVPLITVMDVIEIIPCTEVAIESIKNVKEWTAHD